MTSKIQKSYIKAMDKAYSKKVEEERLHNFSMKKQKDLFNEIMDVQKLKIVSNCNINIFDIVFDKNFKEVDDNFVYVFSSTNLTNSI